MASRSSLQDVSYLLDVNVLIARIDSDHVAHAKVLEWFQSKSRRATWNLCPFTEAGFLRVLTNPRYPNSISMEEALHLLSQMEQYAGYGFWPIESSITSLVQPFAHRLYGHQQVTDAYLLGLALRKNGILVTLDKALRAMAGKDYEDHVLTLG